MKILLINPPLNESDKGNPIAENLFFNSPPLGLCYIASVLERTGHCIEIIDAPVERFSVGDVARKVWDASPDLIGVTSTTYGFPQAVHLAEAIKRRKIASTVVIGGPHISADPEKTMSPGCFDYGVLGEGEITMLELSEALNGRRPFHNIKGLIFRQNGQIHFRGNRDFIRDLDRLPFPARHLIPIKKYRPQPNDERALPKLSMITSRGCPYGCIFCDKSVFGSTYRFFSAEYIVSEMRHLIDVYGARDIAFLDSTFTLSVERVEGIVDRIKKANLNATWTCSIRANVVTKYLLKKMKEAGCWRVRIGIESGNDEVLKFINKGITKEQVRKVAKWADELGLSPKGFFIIGHISDSKESIRDTITFAKDLPLKDITVQINTPLKNTAQYKLLEREGIQFNPGHSYLNFWKAAFTPKGMSEEHLRRAFSKFYRSFYFQPRVIRYHLRDIFTMSVFRRYLRSIRLISSLFLKKKIILTFFLGMSLLNLKETAYCNSSANYYKDNWTLHALKEFKGFLYAATCNRNTGCQIYRSENGSKWERVVADGFGSPANVGISSIAVFKDQIYVGPQNFMNGVSIYRTSDGVNWEPVIRGGFGDKANVEIHSFCEFENRLYAATVNGITGTQIYRTDNGADWTLITKNGFGDAANFKVRALWLCANRPLSQHILSTDN